MAGPRPNKFSELMDLYVTPYQVSAELIVSLRQLSALYQSGIPFSRALYVISEQATHPKLKFVFAECMRNVSSGWSITHALSIYPGLFPELYVRLIEVGEQTGTLQIMLDKVASHAEKRQERVMKLYSALTYPTFVIVLCLSFLIIGPAFVFKSILEFLKGLNVSLPFSTRLLIFGSSIVRSPIFYIFAIAGSIGGFILLHGAWKARRTRKLIQDLALAIPGIGRLYQTFEVASIARTLATIYDSGMLLLPGLELTKRTVGIVTIQEAMESVRLQVIEGETLFDAFTKTRLFPPVLLQFLNAGEQTGDMGRMLNWAAWLCEQEVEHTLNIFLEALQPIIILIVGIMVGFVIIATMSPMLKVIQGLM
jgi:type II secretory pathway component PulF